ncbi:hypothetical protein [Hymenobacter gummosus]|uniref:hypothetical protein n=1 Tax=Hymenobacter gummosus TaxID=1776032 RepID=UPI000F869DB7|nr:hypothetical protein [Hymenobacter gummosus]
MRKVAATKQPAHPSAADCTIVPELTGKYDHDPYFQAKTNRANDLVQTFGIPKFPKEPEQQ